MPQEAFVETAGPKLVEYQTLREEIGRRSELQHQVFHLYVVAVAGGAALIGTNLSTEMLLLVLGLVGLVFGHWYLDQALGIETIGRYLAGDVEPSINRSYEFVESHIRWERGYRITDNSISVAFQNLEVVITATFLLPTVVTFVWASRAMVSDAFNGELVAALLHLFYMALALVLSRSLVRTYLNWVYLIKNRRIHLNLHAVRRLLESAITHGEGSAVTSFTPIPLLNPDGPDNQSVASITKQSGTAEPNRFSPLSPIEQLRSPEVREAMETLSMHCLKTYRGRMTVQVTPTNEYNAKQEVWKYLMARVVRKPQKDPVAGSDNVIVARMRFTPLAAIETKGTYESLGTFTIQNEEVVDISEETVMALHSLFKIPVVQE